MGTCRRATKHQVPVGAGPGLSLDRASVLHQTNERSRPIPAAAPGDTGPTESTALRRGHRKAGERNAVSGELSQQSGVRGALGPSR